MSSPLVDVDELVALLADDACTLLDVRYRMGGPPGAEEFARGHVPGAAYVDLDSALASAPGPLRPYRKPPVRGVKAEAPRGVACRRTARKAHDG